MTTVKEKLFNFFFNSANEKIFCELGALCILISGLIDAYLWFIWFNSNSLKIAYDMTTGYFVPSWIVTLLCLMNFVLILVILKWWDYVP